VATSAGATGLEPATSGVTDRSANRGRLLIDDRIDLLPKPFPAFACVEITDAHPYDLGMHGDFDGSHANRED
jgi:hypothetical protein